LVSILFPWWGITATGFGLSTSSTWGFFGGPSHNPDINNASGFSNTITTYSPIILALVLLSTALAIAGSFTPRVRILAGSLETYLLLPTYILYSSSAHRDEAIAMEIVMNARRISYDPEIPVNIVDLGLVYGVAIDDDSVKVRMTLTTVGCPAHAYLMQQVQTEI